jgi:hypothetical protein
MRGLARFYVVLSCLLCGGLLGGAAFFAAAFIFVPEWVGQVAYQASVGLRTVSAALERQVGEGRPLVTAASDKRPEPLAAPGDGSAGDLGAGAKEEGRLGLPSEEEADSAGRAESLSATLDRLETDVALWKALPGVEPVQARARVAVERLEAWEGLRAPLLVLVERLADGAEVREPLDAASDIRDLAGDLASRLDDLAQSIRQTRTGVLGEIDPRNLAFLLADDRCVPEAEAVECLAELPAAESGAVLDRLARLSPQRASRLLRGLRQVGQRRGDSGEVMGFGAAGERFQPAAVR